MHLFALSTAQLHLALAVTLALATGAYGVLIAVVVLAAMALRHVARSRLAALDHRSGESHITRAPS